MTELCYSKSRDGASQQTFHDNCVGHQPWCFLAKLRTNASVVRVVGGYIGGHSGASVPTYAGRASGNFYAPSSYLFSVTNSHVYSMSNPTYNNQASNDWRGDIGVITVGRTDGCSDSGCSTASSCAATT